MWRILFTLVMFFALACESSSGAEGGTSAPTGPKVGDDGGQSADGAVPGTEHGQSGDEGQPPVDGHPPEDTIETTPDDPVKKLVWEQVQGKTVCFDTESVYGVTCGPTKIIPQDEMTEGMVKACAVSDVGWLLIENEGHKDAACIEADWTSLSLCKNDAASCSGWQKKGAIFLGSCAFPGGQTAPTPCTRYDTCGNGGYCNTGMEQKKKIVLQHYVYGETDAYFEYFFPEE